MQLHTLQSQVRATGRKGFTNQVRENGGVPAVIYGGAQSNPVSASVNRKALEKILHTEGGRHAVVQLQFDDMPDYNSPVLIRATQRHPVKGALLHVDFMRIRLDERIQTKVSVVLVGRAKGIIEGGVLDHQLREVDIECLAMEVPEHFEVDITALGLGESIHVSDLKISEGITILTDTDLAIASIHAPRVAKAAEEEVEETPETAEAESAE